MSDNTHGTICQKCKIFRAVYTVDGKRLCAGCAVKAVGGEELGSYCCRCGDLLNPQHIFICKEDVYCCESCLLNDHGIRRDTVEK